MSLETAQKVFVPQKKNYVPHFLKQRDINSYINPLESFSVPATCNLNRYRFNFVKFMAIFELSLLCFAGSGIRGEKLSGSGINVQDQQHWPVDVKT